MATIKATKPFENRFKVEKGRQMLPFFFCGIDAIDGIDVFECPVPVRESVVVRSVPCEREGESLGSLRNIGEIDTIYRYNRRDRGRE